MYTNNTIKILISFSSLIIPLQIHTNLVLTTTYLLFDDPQSPNRASILIYFTSLTLSPDTVSTMASQMHYN